MAMKLSEVKAKVATTTLAFMDETVDVGYHPASVTPAMLEDILAMAKSADGDSADSALIGKMLDPMLAWWDVLDDDGERIPADAEHIRDMPMAFLTALLGHLQKETQPDGGKA